MDAEAPKKQNQMNGPISTNKPLSPVGCWSGCSPMERTMKKRNVVALSLALLGGAALLFPELADAASSAATNKAESRGQDIVDFLTGSFAVILVTIAIIISAIGVIIMKRMEPMTALYIIGGALVIGSAADLAAWALS